MNPKALLIFLFAALLCSCATTVTLKELQDYDERQKDENIEPLYKGTKNGFHYLQFGVREFRIKETEFPFLQPFYFNGDLRDWEPFAIPPREKARVDSVLLKKHLKDLDQLVRVFLKTQAAHDQFGETFWIASKKLADSEGPAIFHAVMEKSKKWKGEEGLIYVPLVALLPRRETLRIIGQYENGDNQKLKSWANEFLIEFGMSDTKVGAKYYSEKIPRPPSWPPPSH